MIDHEKDYDQAAARRAVLRVLNSAKWATLDEVAQVARDGDGKRLSKQRAELALDQLIAKGTVERVVRCDVEVYECL